MASLVLVAIGVSIEVLVGINVHLARATQTNDLLLKSQYELRSKATSAGKALLGNVGHKVNEATFAV